MKQPKALIEHYKRLFKIEENDFRNSNLRKLVLLKLKKGSVLDIGSGTGKMAIDAYHAGHKPVLAVDLDEELLGFVKKHTKKNKVPVKTKLLPIEKLKSLGKNKFDNVICLDVLEHVGDEYLAAGNIYSVLKKGGIAVINVPAYGFLFGERDKAMGHFRRYSRAEIVNLLERAGFKIKFVRYWNVLGFFIYLLFEKILKTRVNERVRYKPENNFEKLLQKLLYYWVAKVENTMSSPFGLSVFVVAKKDG